MSRAELSLRVILALMALLALGLIVLTYPGETLCLNVMAAGLQENRGAGASGVDKPQANLKANFQ